MFPSCVFAALGSGGGFCGQGRGGPKIWGGGGGCEVFLRSRSCSLAPRQAADSRLRGITLGVGGRGGVHHCTYISESVPTSAALGKHRHIWSENSPMLGDIGEFSADFGDVRRMRPILRQVMPIWLRSRLNFGACGQFWSFRQSIGELGQICCVFDQFGAIFSNSRAIAAGRQTQISPNQNLCAWARLNVDPRTLASAAG